MQGLFFFAVKSLNLTLALAPCRAFMYPQSMQELLLCFMRAQAEALYGGLPTYATPHAAGLDLRACFDASQHCLEPGERVLVPSGLAVQPMAKPQEHVAGFVYSRSGLGAKHGITVAQGVGVIDADYRGEIMIMLLNTSQKAYVIERGERVAQLVFQPIFRPAIRVQKELDSSLRGAGGFGHTGQQ